VILGPCGPAPCPYLLKRRIWLGDEVGASVTNIPALTAARTNIGVNESWSTCDEPKLAWIGILIDRQRGRGVLDEKK
jgi:hypothetical protein